MNASQVAAAMVHTTDVRDTDPNRDQRRRARYVIGYWHAITRRRYTERTLARLTWQNLGYRHGLLLRDPTRALAMYDRAVASL